MEEKEEKKKEANVLTFRVLLTLIRGEN